MSERLDADECDRMIEQFRGRLEVLQNEATDVRRQFDELHRRWLGYIERSNGARTEPR